MEFIIDADNIELSFNRIADYLLFSSVININEEELEITEIEFYYFKEGVHEDKYTHPHKREAGEWRLHKQGIDITFKGNEIEDGGILIRGIKHKQKYINGPLKTLNYIFEMMGKVQIPCTLYLKEKELARTQIYKTFRHIPNKVQYETFHSREYRFLKDFEYLTIEPKLKKHIEEKLVLIE
jgi:hypothetical protein